MTDTVSIETYAPGTAAPQRTGTATVTIALSPGDQDEQTIRANIAAAKTALQNATATVNAATNTTAVAALQQYAQANNQAWNALLPALKYIAARLAS